MNRRKKGAAAISKRRRRYRLSRREVADRLIPLIGEELQLRDLTDLSERSRLVEDLKADSLDLTELQLKIEEEFDRTIGAKDEAEVNRCQTVGELIDWVHHFVNRAR